MAKNEEQFKEEDMIGASDDEECVDYDEFMNGGNFLKNPAVGSSVEFTIAKIIKRKAKIQVNPKNQKKMKIALSSVDYYYDFFTQDDKTYTPLAWQVIGKIKAIGRKLGKLEGVILKVTRIADGYKDQNVKECYKVQTMIDGQFKELSRETNEWC